MESESDGEEMLDATYSSMEQPPLIKQLRGILSEYPDNGQIIKEMLQNAEDAEAHQVEIIYDERCINQVEDKKKTFRKFFKGPALCVKNNSLFDERDWKGIKMIASSVKEDDKLKVGRFGLGFKSVFHMTDYPCIMSGDRILLVDPMRLSDQVNAEIKLKNLRKTRGMDIDAFFGAFQDTLNINESIIEQGFYQGTVFWFPLRGETSKISSTVYDREKVMDLFASFEHDSSEILLFLCHLESVSLHIRSPHGQLKSVASAEISGNKKEVQQRRDDFIKLIKETSKSNRSHEPVICTYEMTMSTRNKDGSVDNTKWRIVHYLMVANCSTRLRQLVNDPDLGYNPLVGVAMPTTNTEHQQPFEGHVFCFMPLPREGSRLTGLPVHVNGFFSLSQNRHHLKWATDDQRVREIKDKDILWNQALIEECVPEAYKKLFEILLKKANENRNDIQSVERIHKAVPDEKIVIDKWKRIPNQLTSYLNQLKILYSHCQKKYVLISEALFATNESRTKDILKVISQLDVNYVEASMETITKLKFYNGNKVRDLTQSMLADLLRKNIRILLKLSVSEKFSILAYLLSGNNYNSCLAGLPLLPVASGKWLTFGSGENVFICNSIEEIQLFEECQDRMIHQTSYISEEIWSDLEEMASSKIAQIRKLDVTAFKELLNATLQRKVGPSHIISSQAQLEWFKNVWTYIENNFYADQFEEFPLIPELKEGTWNGCKKIQLHPLNRIFLNKNGMPDNISKCFNILGAVVLNDFPPWFSKYFVRSYLCSYEIHDSTGICKLLEKLWAQPSKQRQTQINKFNSSINFSLLDKFVAFMSNQVNLTSSSINLLRSLQMFKYGDFSANNTSYTTYNEQYVMNTGLPLRLPKAFIMGNEDSIQLLKRLGACEVAYEDQVLLILAEMRIGSKYSQQDTKKFMNYFLEHIWKFWQSKAIMGLAYEIPFLKTEHGTFKAKDLFTPEDELLKAMFYGETDKFPLDFSYFTSHCKNALTQLGLKEINMVSAQNVADVTSLIHKWSSDPKKYSTCVTKSKGVLALLNKNPSLLQHVYGRFTLHDHLLQQRFVPCIHQKPSQFPTSLPHFNKRFCTPNEARERSYENECMVGATMPLVDPTHSNISSQFGWNSRPPCDKVIDQLMLLKQYFKVEEKSSSSPMIEQIYQYLSENISSINSSKIKTEGLIWAGDSFEHPEDVIIRIGSQGLTNLRPYFFNIPVEFSKYEEFFETVGCVPYQTVSVLIEALSRIEKKHHNPQPFDVYEGDFELVVKIVEKLAERRHEIQGYDVILPVQYDSSSQIRFHPASKSTVDKNAAKFVHEEGDNTIIFVHQRISQDAAKALGAKPLNKQILMGTESMGIEGFGQTEKLTDRINKLITESYVDGLSVPKELIQNADDAGANVVKFLFDEREHEDARNLLLSQEMAGCQGPSLVVYNSATFSDADFENIKKLNGATKEMDRSKVGRFGLGFCAVYNLTDVPSFISRSTVVIFDPQKSYLQNALEDNSPGIKIDFKRIENRKLLRLHEDQFKPYKGLFGCDVDKLPEKEYKGTIFRLPLRNSIQAGMSEISKLSYNRDEVCDLLTMLAKNVGNMLLFTQNVQRIELYHLPKMAKSFEDRVLIFSAGKRFENTIPKPLQDPSCTILQRVTTALRMGKHFVETEQLKIEVCLTSHCSKFLRRTQDMKCSDESAWLIVWETGQKESLEISKRVREERAVPLSAVAVQCDPNYNFPVKDLERNTSFYEAGHLFCFLPLPIETSLPFHLNGSFHVTSDRRRLVALTDDDKTSRKDRWNECLMSDASVNALFTLMEYFSQRNIGGSYSFYYLWPLHCQQAVIAIHQSFFQRLIYEGKPLFWGNERWAPFSDIVFLDASIRNNPDIGSIGFKMLSCIGKTRGKVLVDLPDELVSCLKKVQNIEESIITETEFLKLFLANVDNTYWNEHVKDRNAILVYALMFENIEIKRKMKEYRCIPVEPSGTLRRPCDIVDCNGKVAAMYKIEEEVFLHRGLQNKAILDELYSLGMVRDRLSDEMLLDRFAMIEKLAITHSARCALNLCQLLMNYLNDTFVRKDLKEKVEVRKMISEMFIFPVLEKPKNWKFTWKANNDGNLKTFHSRSDSSKEKDINFTLKLGQPKHLYKQDLQLTGGSVCSFVDENMITGRFSLHKEVLKVLQISKYVPTKLIIEQIGVISQEYDHSQEKHDNAFDIFSDILKCLQTRIKKEEKLDEVKTEFTKISSTPYIIVQRNLYTPNQVVFNLEHECPPYIVKAPDMLAAKYKDVFEAMGVRDHLEVRDIIFALREVKSLWKDTKCNDTKLIRNLLQNLAEIDDCDFAESVKDIVAPDSNGFLYPMNELVTSEDDFKTNRKMHVLHESIPHDIAKRLGAKDKQRKCHDDISKGIPFGQKEKLETRIKNLLESYPCDSSIMKELLQNADDAKATKIMFIKDYRKLSTQNIFAESCNNFQGPSLCVFNDSYFTDKDLQGIHNLGEGSKRQDPTKIGRFGVGFNSVYHLTDTPAFLSKGPDTTDDGFLVIFDPTCSTLPGVDENEPGRFYKVKDLQDEFRDILTGFNCREKLFVHDRGTMFRFPLRRVESSVSNKVHSEQTINTILEETEKELFESLLFVKNVQCIEVANIDSGELVVEYSVRAEMSKEDQLNRSEFFEHIKKMCKEVKQDGSQLITVETKEVCYEMKVSDSKRREETFSIVQKFGFNNPSEIPHTIIETFRRENLGYLPWGGVAYRKKGNRKMPITSTYNSNSAFEGAYQAKSNKESKAFCFLPIPGETPLPVHVNGCFCLDDARRGLIKGGFGEEWNKCVLKYLVVPAYTRCVTIWRDILASRVDSLKKSHEVENLSGQYHEIFPLMENILDPYMKYLTVEFYRFIIHGKYDLFPVFKIENESKTKGQVESSIKDFKCEWVPMGLKGDLQRGCFNTLGDLTHKEKEKLETILKDIGLKIIHTPHKVRTAVMKCGLGYKSDMEKSVIENMGSDTVSEDVNVELKNAGNPSCTHPDEVVAFITTSTIEGGPCFIGYAGSKITNTKVQSLDRLKLLLNFITKSKDFTKKLPYLLVLLTGTNELTFFSKEQPLYSTEFSWMFPSKMDKFVHHNLLMSYPTAALLKEGYLKDFSFSLFIELIPDKFKENLFDKETSVDWNTENSSFPSKQWIAWFWKFVYDFSKREKDTNRFKEVMEYISEWAFLPALEINNKMLLQVSKIFLLTDIASFSTDEPLQKTLLKLQLLTLDKNVFYEGKYDISEIVSMKGDRENLTENSVLNTEPTTVETNFAMKEKDRSIAIDIVTTIQGCASSYYKPASILENLAYHTKHYDPSIFNRINAGDALVILKYFTEKLRDSQFKEYSQCKDKLVSLPLFATLNNTCVSLDGGGEPFLVPEGTPCVGLDIFSVNMNKVFLRKYSDLDDLYTFLGLSGTNACHLYACVILPNFLQIPRKFWLEHIVYIRDNYRSWKEPYLQECKSILYYLKNIPFVETNACFKTSSCFFDHNNPEFKVLCTDDEFLPEHFRIHKWTSFLKKLGMHCGITDDLLIMFAKRIEDECATNSCIEDMSTTLSFTFTKYLESWKEETLHVLAKIHFLLPVQLKKMFHSIFPQRDDGFRLICMQDAVQAKHVALCWSTANVLRINIGKKYHNILGVSAEPVFKDVLKHCQNITTELKKKIGRYKESEVRDLMNTIYLFLQQHQRDLTTNQMLHSFPIIHLPTEKEMVSANDIVLSISDSDIVKPYLFRAPVQYGPFFDLFHSLGMSKEVNCYHFLQILYKVALQAGNQEVSLPELMVIKKSVWGLWLNLKKEMKSDFKNLKLYLPNSHKVMCESTDLVMVDNTDTRDRLNNVTDINYFIGVHQLEINFLRPLEFVKLLPDHLRPMLLTNVVKEVADTERMETFQNSRIAETLSYFIQSEQFIRGMCRIAKKDKESRMVGKDIIGFQVDVERITELISRISIFQVIQLETYLFHKNEKVEGSQRPLDMFSERKSEEDGLYSLQFYFCLYPGKDEDETLMDMIINPGGLAAAITEHTGLPPDLPYDEVLMVAQILRQLDNPDNIALLLDKKKYPELDVSLDLKATSIFPRPGSYVEDKFHPFLQQSLDPFDESEYKTLAYEVDDEDSDDETEESNFSPVYKYVHIIEKISTHSECSSLVGIRYKINIGEIEPFEVPGYRLYRFVRPENQTDTLQVHTGVSPQQFLPFDENSKRIRKILQEAWRLQTRDRRKVFQRLLFQWHPDKNRGSEEYATKVFQFVQQCILELEETGSLSEGDETDGRSPNFSNSSYNQMYNNVNRRAKAYARAYYNNLDEYNRSQNTGNYNHRNAAQAEVKDVGEARRWMRQAKRDFQAAEAMLQQAEDQKAFNWICYICHQASEKALKAGCYSKNANAVSLQDHNLYSPASRLSPSLTSLATQMENHLGQHTRMRYPNSVNRPQIPADIFNKDHAVKAIDLAREIIEHADEFI